MARLAWVGCLLLAAATAVTVAVAESEAEALSTYIVHVAPAHAPRSSRPRVLSSAYNSFLRDHLPACVARPAPRVLYSYAHAATGFAARLTASQAAHLASQGSVLAVVPDMTHQLHTTLTPSFLGLSESSGLLPASGGAMDVVIGFIDSGVYPKDRASFAADPSVPPPPRTFRGGCVSTPEFNASAYCNNKLVGAKFFYLGYQAAHGGSAIEEAMESRSPLDTDGHGTHVSSTAAGSAVAGAAFFDYAKGKAVGMAPGARIAAYKACWAGAGCTSSDLLMAFDEAIKDGVNVISVSLGIGKVPLYSDSVAVGAFSAVRNGIVVSASAGNSGPNEFTAVNVALWILTVGASTVNRQFLANVVLGNGENLTGTSICEGTTTPFGANKIPIVYGGDVGSSVCEAGKLNSSTVAGKIVVCDAGVNGRADKGEAVKVAGGAGAILASRNDFGEQPSVATAHVLPAAGVTFAAAEKMKKYIRETASPVATIVFLGTVIGQVPSAPRMASFSSRGPSFIAPEILKPDVTAPGVETLAAWTGDNSPSQLVSDTRRVKFNIISGTSMSCPHVAGVAALLRQIHPDWSPAAIKSALMTTAYNVDNTGSIIKDMSTGEASTPFVRGAGHVDPNRATDPGLVYDAGTNDYISFLCALGYTTQQIAVLTRDGSVTGCWTRPSSAVGDHNYPAFSVVFRSGDGAVTQRRVVRNVGNNTGATYTARITGPAGVRVKVQPSTLQFSTLQKTREYVTTFTPQQGGSVTGKHTFGSIVWSDGKHKVTSPIAITWPVTQVVAM
ncbi:unnamed protein product [Urochloa decumbens]|uniref:Subtilisin-like protease n=1 Tax=Urochloa decumbens TaxID=240449 RepID=A0ABC9ASE1_9POAL